MKNERTHVLSVPLRRRKFRRQVRVGVVTHAYNNRVYMQAYTLCGIPYTHKAYRVGKETMLATRTSRDVDCMACLVLRGRE